MKHDSLLISLAIAVSVLAVACGKKPDISSAPAKASASSAPTATVDNSESQAIKKMNAYVSANNHLVGMFYGQTQGLGNLLRDYQKQDIPSKTKVDANTSVNLYLNLSMLRNSMSDLRKAQNFKGNSDLAKIETIAEGLLIKGDALIAQGSDLEAYFESKKYMEDKLAKAKAENTAFVSLWQKFSTEFDAFKAELDVLERSRRLAAVKKLRAEGNNRLAANQEAMLATSEMLALFSQRSDFKNPEKLKSSDALAAQLELLATEIKTENDALKDKQADTYRSIFEKLNQFLGAYRSAKSKSDPAREFGDMVRYYNDLVKEQRLLR